MKKFVALFTDSYRELKSVRTITTMAMLAAIAIILGMFSIEYGNFIRIGFFKYPERNHCLSVWPDSWRHFFRNA